MDWHLPGMDGIEAANQIQQHSTTPTATIIMVSAYRKETVFKAANATGIDVFLEKPINPSLFYNDLVETFEEGVRKDYHRQVDTSSLKDQLTTLNASAILLKYICRKCDPLSLSSARSPDGSSAKDSVIKIPEFISIDKDMGLKHIMGNSALYSRLLKDFAREYKDGATTLVSLLAEDKEAAERLAHTIKGLSATGA